MNPLFSIEEKRLRNIIAENPLDISARLRLALLLEEKGSIEESHEEYKKILEIDPNNNSAFCRLNNLIQSKQEKRGFLRYHITPGSEIIEESLFLFHEQTWDVMKKENDLMLIPASQRYNTFLTRLNKWSRNIARRELEKEGFSFFGSLNLKKEEDIREDGWFPVVELGKSFEGIFPALLAKIPLLFDRFLKESGILIPRPEFRITSELDDERYRILWGHKLLAHGGIKKEHVFLISENLDEIDLAGIDTYNETLQIAGRWVPHRLRTRLLNSGYTVFDSTTHILENLFHILTQNLHLIINEKKTEQFIQFLKESNRHFPWREIETQLPLSVLTELLRYYIIAGGNIKNGMNLFHILADCVGETQNPYFIKKYILESLTSLVKFENAKEKEELYAFCLPPELEEKLLAFIHDDESEEALLCLSPVFTEIMESSMKIRETDKVPALICHSDIRPFITDCLAPYISDLLIVADSEINLESPPYVLSLAKKESPGSHSLEFFFISDEELDLKGRRVLQVASIVKDQKRSFIFLPGACLYTDSNNVLLNFQERGYRLEGIYSLTYHEGQETVVVSPEFAKSHPISVQLGQEVFHLLTSDSEFKSMVTFLRSTVEREYGIMPPEIHFVYDPGMDPLEYTIIIGYGISETEKISQKENVSVHFKRHEAPSESATDHVLNHLLAMIEHNLKELIHYDLVEKFVQAAQKDLPAFCQERVPRKKIKDVITELVSERVPVKKPVLIIKKILENPDDEPYEIAEKIRNDLRDDIVSHLIERFGKVTGINLDPDMEIILTTSLFSDPYGLLEKEPTQEREYLARLIVNEYLILGGGKIRFPIFCSKSLRRLLKDMIRVNIPEVLVIARDELYGIAVEYVGTIRTPKGFFKFITDEMLKQGILYDYEAEEEKALDEIRKHLREEFKEKKAKESQKEEKKESSSFFTVKMGRALAEDLESQNAMDEFNGFILFLREWMERSQGRQVPQVKVITDEELDENVFALCIEGYDQTFFPLHCGSRLLISSNRRGRKGENILGTLYGIWIPDNERPPGESLSVGEVILLHLYTALKNFSRFYQALPAIESRTINLAKEKGQSPEEFRNIYSDLLHLGAHPFLILDAVRMTGREIDFLGEEAKKERLFKLCTAAMVSHLYTNDRKIPAVTINDQIEAFFSGYLKDIHPDVLIPLKPKSLKQLASYITTSLKKLMEAGFAPIVITEKIAEKNLLRLIESEIPQVQVFRRSTLPPESTIQVIDSPRINQLDLFTESQESQEFQNLSLFTSLSDYYLFQALLNDFKGRYNEAASMYERILKTFTYHATALWRGAFCIQRQGDQEKARSFRIKALRSFKSLPFTEPAYYHPDYERAEYEYNLQAKRLTNNGSPGVAEFRLGYCAYLLEEKTQAEKYLKLSLKNLEYDDEAHVTFAHLLADKEAYRESEKQYKKALRLNPWNREAQKGMAMVFSEESKSKKSWATYCKLLAKDPDNNELLNDFGYVCQDRDDYQSLLKVSNAILEADPENTMALFMRSKAHHHLGYFDKEISDIRQGLKIDPSGILLNRSLGDILWSVGLFDEARKHYLEVFRTKEELSHTIFHRVRILMSLGDLITSQKLLLETLEKDGKLQFSTLYHLMGEITLKLGHLSEAEYYFRKAHKINSSSLIYELDCAEVTLLRGEKQKAEKIYQKVLKLAPASLIVYPKLARILAEKGHKKESLNILKTGMGWAPGYLDLYTVYFSLQSEQGEIELWKKHFLERASLDPLNPSFHFCLGLISTHLGDNKYALKEFERAYLLSPDVPLIIEYLCRLLIMENEPERALVILRVALKKILRSSSLYFLEGVCWKALGNPARAKESFLKSSHLDPLFPYACVSRAYMYMIDNKKQEAEKEAEKALRYNGLFGPALLILADIKEGERESLTEKAKALSTPEIWGLI